MHSDKPENNVVKNVEVVVRLPMISSKEKI